MLAIPAGHVAALVGPNGAGKTTLLNLAVGLAKASAGGVTVLGGLPPGSPAALDGIAFVAQDTPVYKNLSAADMLHLTRNLNRRFDQHYAEVRLAELGIPLNRKAGKLSGGQRARHRLAGPPPGGLTPTSQGTGCQQPGRPAAPDGTRTTSSKATRSASGHGEHECSAAGRPSGIQIIASSFDVVMKSWSWEPMCTRPSALWRPANHFSPEVFG